MGRILNIICKNCGYKKEGFRGGGNMSNHRTYSGVLALNTENAEVENINNFEYLENKDNKFSIYKPYYNPEMSIKDGDERTGGHYDDIKYKYTGNYCPKCKQYKLVIFASNIFTD